MKEKVLLLWSGGKKSAMALELLSQDASIEVIGLVSFFEKETNRIPLHGTPDSIILEQAKLLKLPLQRIFLSEAMSDHEFIELMTSKFKMYEKKGIRTLAVGDLEVDVEQDRRFKIGLKVLTPLLKMNSNDFNSQFFQQNFKAFVTAVKKDELGYNFLACEYNDEYINRLPIGIDQASRNKEFHTFVIYGPSFSKRVAFSKAIAVEENNYLVSLVKEP